MKKITLLSFSIFVSIICLSNLDGALPGNTNAPGEFTCGRAPCHNVPINVGDAEMSITFGEDETAYFPDSIFLLKVKITNPMTSRNGFQILALDENLQNAGTWQLIEPDKMKIIDGFSDPTKKYVTHQVAGNQQEEWALNWKAPAGDVGKVTFYASVLSANDNGENTGDEVYNTNIEIDFALPSAIEEMEASSIKVYPVISTTGVWVELPCAEKNFKLYLYNMGGVVVAQKTVPHGGMQLLEINDLASGLYFLKIEDEEGEVGLRRIFVR